MPWTERQVAILGEIGVRVWQAGVATVTAPAKPLENAAAPVAAGPQEPAGRVAQRAGAASEVAPLARSAPTSRPVAPAATPARPASAVSPTPGRSNSLSQRTAAPAPPARAARVDDPARGEAIAAMDWVQLRAAVAACRACELCDSRRQTVFGAGSEQAHWLIVGEAPGETEDLAGEPFVGKAGQLLDRMLAALALSRSAADPARQVFIANTLKCRPPRNRNPAPVELAQCKPFLERQIELVQPRIIVALGRFAVDVVLGSSVAIGQLRGRIHRWREIPVVVSYHPSYLLRQPEEKGRAWDDWCLAAEVAERG
jgi:DNA polymerase